MDKEVKCWQINADYYKTIGGLQFVLLMKIKTQYINSSTPVQLIILCSFTAALAKIASVDWCKNSSTAHLRSLCV